MNGSFWKSYSYIITAILLFTSLIYYYEYTDFNSKYNIENPKNNETVNILYNMMTYGTSLRKHYQLSFYRILQIYPTQDSGKKIAVIYIPENNVTLRLNMYLQKHENLSIPISIQRGDALDFEDATISEVKNNIKKYYAEVINQIYITGTKSVDFVIKEKGWYTISVIGPIRFDEFGTISSRPIGLIQSDKDFIAIPIFFEMDIGLFCDGNLIPFLVKDYRHI